MKALLLVGSPRKGKSASETLGAYLLKGLEARGVATAKAYVYAALAPGAGPGEKLDALVEAVAQADLVILTAPLYVDSLPAPVTRLLEVLARRLHEQARPAGQRWVAISNSGFPEAHQNDIALAIQRQFARQAGFSWAGGMALGAGEAVKGRPLEQSGGMARNVMAALDRAAEALAALPGQPIPQEATDLMAQPLMPAWLYRAAGSFGWWTQAWSNRTLGRLRTRAWEQ